MHSAGRFAAATVLGSFGTGLLVPVLSLLFLARGLSYPQLAGALAVYSAAAVLLEVPSGVAADRWGRKRTWLLSLGLSAAAMGTLLLWSGHTASVCAMAAYGAGRALQSGSLDALWIDTHTAAGGEMSRVVTLQCLCDTAGLALGALAGGALYALQPDCRLNLLARGVCCLLAALPAAGLCEAPRAAGGASLRLQLRQTGQVLRACPVPGALLAGTLFTGMALSSLEAYWQPQLTGLLGPAGPGWLLGILGFLYYAVCALGTLAGGALARRMHTVLLYTGGRVLVCAALTALAGAASAKGFAACYLALYLCFGASSTAEGILLNRHAPARVRASLLSLQGFALQAGGLLGCGLAWLVTARGSVPFLWRICAGILLAGTFLCAARMGGGKGRRHS